MILCQLEIPGLPAAKERPRVTKNGVYTPKRTRHWENGARMMMQAAMRHDPETGPVSLQLTAYFLPPTSWPKWRVDLIGEVSIWHIVRPDLDNVEKSLLDAANGIVYIDDAQICQVTKRKIYAWKPCVRATFETLGGVHSRSLRAESN